MCLKIKNLSFFDMIRKKYPKIAIWTPIITFKQGLQGMLFLRIHYPWAFMGYNADKLI